MNRKLDDKTLERCRTFCLSNELLVIPPTIDDAGLMDYFFEKTSKVKQEKYLVEPIEKCGLMLQFPKPTQGQEEVNLFFDSPRVFNRNRPFHGCFMIDISSYGNNIEHPFFEKLKTYIAENLDCIVFLLVVASDNENVIKQIRKALSSCGNFRLSSLDTPSSVRVVEYVTTKLGQDNFSEKCLSDLNMFFSAHPDFRIADSIIDYATKSNDESISSSLSSFISDFNSFNDEGCKRRIGF